MKLVKRIQLKIVIFTDVKNHCMLHGHVCVMCDPYKNLPGQMKISFGRKRLNVTKWYRAVSQINSSQVCFVTT